MTKTGEPLVFIKEVAKYFMDFLETDFHKRKTPKRSIQLRNPNNLLIGINTSKYPNFNDILWNLINQGFDNSILNTINKNTYRTNIPKNLLDLIVLQADKINNKQINAVLKSIGDLIIEAVTLHNKDYDNCLNYSLESIKILIKKDILSPFISNLEKPLETSNI